MWIASVHSVAPVACQAFTASSARSRALIAMKCSAMGMGTAQTRAQDVIAFPVPETLALVSLGL